MKKLLISLMISLSFLLVSGCSKKAKEPATTPSTSQSEHLSGSETPAESESSTAPDSEHVSGSASSSSNISGN